LAVRFCEVQQKQHSQEAVLPKLASK